MKRKFLYTLIAALVLTFTIVMISHKPADVDASTPLTVEQLFTNYYDDGAYTKETEIFVDTDKVGADFFHAGVTHLKRITYYKPDKLWMTNKERTINSGYGTSENGHLTHFVKDLNDTSIELDVVEYDWLPGMEEYYLTLHDFMVGTHNSAHSNNEDLNLASGWTYANGVYTNSNVDLIEAYRLFTAPLFLQLTETNKHYFSFSHVTLEVVDNKLVMCLWVDGDNEGVMTSELVDGHYLFSKAVINSYDHPVLTYGGTKSGTAEFDYATNIHTFTVDLAVWNSVKLYLDGVPVDVLDENISVTGDIFHNKTANGAGSKLYYEHIYDWDANKYTDVLDSCTLYTATGGTYVITFNGNTNTLDIDYIEPKTPDGTVKVDVTNVDAGQDKVAVWTNSGAVMYDGTSWFGSNGWRLIIVVDAEGKVCYATNNPIGGYGNAYSVAENNYKASYSRHSDYKDYLTNPAFSNLSAPSVNKWGAMSVTFNVVIPEGGFAITAQGVGADALATTMGLSGVSAYQTSATNLDNVKLSYNSASGLVEIMLG